MKKGCNLEQHPFGFYIPEDSENLILGSFPPREFTQSKKISKETWFYGSPKNDFWRILEIIYRKDLKLKKDKKDLLKKIKTGMGDIIIQCNRMDNNNSDQNLTDIKYNSKLMDIIKSGKIKNIYFTSRYVEKGFYKIISKIIKNEPDEEDNDIVKYFAIKDSSGKIKTITLLSPSRSINRFIAGLKKYKEFKNSGVCTSSDSMKSFIDFKSKQYYKYLPKLNP
ncbi:MAG: hypothetical protein NTY22_03380 [Proteobacteria bacterium]|nr:hypothetical protein [Pseudomonadota bacterium]